MHCGNRDLCVKLQYSTTYAMSHGRLQIFLITVICCIFSELYGTWRYLCLLESRIWFCHWGKWFLASGFEFYQQWYPLHVVVNGNINSMLFKCICMFIVLVIVDPVGLALNKPKATIKMWWLTCINYVMEHSFFTWQHRFLSYLFEIDYNCSCLD